MDDRTMSTSMITVVEFHRVSPLKRFFYTLQDNWVKVVKLGHFQFAKPIFDPKSQLDFLENEAFCRIFDKKNNFYQ